MVSAFTIIAFAATTLATAVENADLTLNVLLKRQETTSGAQYECHADCGYTILDASPENCDNSTWTDLLNNCEACANTYNILRYYGDQVGAAAEDCGLTATFAPSGGASSASSTVSSAASSTDTIVVATETTSQVEASTPAVEAATSTSQTAVASGTILPSPSSNGTSNGTQPAAPTGTEEFEGAAVKVGSYAGATVLAVFVILQCLL